MPLPHRRRFSLRLPARSITLGPRTLLMGILNVTPDSFSERGRYFDKKAAIQRGLELEREGADLLDIGGESTRPGALPVDTEEEMDRTIPVIESLRNKGLRIPVSIDTYKAQVAERALQAGAEIVNDVSGLRYDSSMAGIVARARASIILMHLRGTPRSMQQLAPVQDIVATVRKGLAGSLRQALRAGVRKTRIVLDPGIGFGKTAAQSFELLGALHRVANLGYPVLAGPSRKSFLRASIIQPLSTQGHNSLGRGVAERSREVLPEELLLGTAAALTAAILNGAHIVRVHDVRQMIPVAQVADRFLENRQGKR